MIMLTEYPTALPPFSRSLVALELENDVPYPIKTPFETLKVNMVVIRPLSVVQDPIWTRKLDKREC